MSVRQNEKKIKELEEKVSSHDRMRDNLILKALRERKPGLNSFQYTYSEIAEIYDVKKSYVQRLASANGIVRRELKVI